MTSLSQSISTRTCALAASLFAAAVVLFLSGYGEQLGAESWTITVCRTDSKGQLSDNIGAGDIGPEKTSVEQWPSFCKSKYGAINHLRISTPPLDFQWLALNSSVSNVTLKGPTGDDVPLTKLGQLPLINSTVYSLPNPFNFASGQYRLFLSSETAPVSSFPLHPHGCSCPESLENFSDRYGCSAQAVEIVRKSIAKWPKRSVTREIYEHPVIHDSDAILQFAIVKNKLYCKKTGNQHCPPGPRDAGRSADITALIQRVLRKVKVPDVWLMWNIEDKPVLGAYAIQPVFSPSGSSFHRDLLLPTPYMVATKFRGLDIYVAVAGAPWEERESKAYFVGSPTGGPTQHLPLVEGAHKMHPRMRAVELSKQRPDILDATVTLGLIPDQAPPKNGSGFPVVDRLLEGGLLKWKTTGSRALEFKYVLDLPGNSSAWRLGNNIGYGAVTIKSRTPWNEFWHYLLDDGRNVRLTMDLLDDLFDIVEDARRRDQDMKCIAREAQLMSLLALRQEDLLCWVAHTLIELSSIMAFVPTSDDLDLVEIPDLELVDSSLCKCTQ